ncbi:MAG: hypothetical protein AW07_01339 [Candidatus Accumulibacter sp. SK-11]|nr:MAG: hypothetical protein AW07_01339 [Candidatus Accumulibacter sp. SK-11]
MIDDVAKEAVWVAFVGHQRVLLRVQARRQHRLIVEGVLETEAVSDLVQQRREVVRPDRPIGARAGRIDPDVAAGWPVTVRIQ